MLQNFHDKSVYQVATSANEKYIKLWFAIFIRFTKCMPQSLIKLESFIKLDSVECKINIRSERTQNYEMITWIMMQSLIIFSKIIETELLISNGSSILLWKQTNRNLGTCRSPWPRQGAMQGADYCLQNRKAYLFYLVLFEDFAVLMPVSHQVNTLSVLSYLRTSWPLEFSEFLIVMSRFCA